MRTAIKQALAVAAGGGIALAPVLLPGMASAATGGTYYASPTGNDANSGTSCTDGKTLQGAIDAAGQGGTVIACTGTYEVSGSTGLTVAPDRLTLEGQSGAIIDALGLEHFAADVITVTGNFDTIRGITVENAPDHAILITGDNATITSDHIVGNRDFFYDAILLEGSSWSRIAGNTVAHNFGLGIGLVGNGGTAAGACRNDIISGNNVIDNLGTGIGLSLCSNAQIDHNTVTGNGAGGGGSGGIVLNGVLRTSVSHNTVTGNIHGGIGLVDAAGPTAYNDISGNNVTGTDSNNGITLYSEPSTSQGGVYRNTVRSNVVTDNGTNSSVPGAGVLMISFVTGGAVYGNRVEGNQISGNGWPGVTLDGLATGQNMSGNVIAHNTIGTNNLLGGIPGVQDDQHTGILVAGTSPLSIQVVANTISDNHYGIWKNSLVTAKGLNSNRYINVDVPVYTAP